MHNDFPVAAGITLNIMAEKTGNFIGALLFMHDLRVFALYIIILLFNASESA